ncbi:MAG: ketoacyl-ACP synthase III [Phycisphaerae bacterium]|nr:ketoacyl-ACP synthase III [Phycisphaerae bacterium]
MAKALHASIAGFGIGIPPRVLTNADFEKMVDTTDEWITRRTGIKERRVVDDGQATLYLALQAAKEALADAGIEPKQLDLIICATITPELMFPSSACLLQKELGATEVPAFDISAACSGFVYGLAIGDQFIKTGTYKRILVIGVDTLSRFTDYTDRASCILFGDGAGAVVIEATDDENKGVIYSVMHADGNGWDYIHLPGGGSGNPATRETVEAREHFIKMRGRDVYRFAVAKMQWLLGDCMEHCNLRPDDVDMVIPHQVNIRIIKSATEKFNFPLEKVYMNIDRYGNTSGASVPMALVEAVQRGRIGPGSTIILVAFGAGLTWAGSVVRL